MLSNLWSQPACRVCVAWAPKIASHIAILSLVFERSPVCCNVKFCLDVCKLPQVQHKTCHFRAVESNTYCPLVMSTKTECTLAVALVKFTGQCLHVRQECLTGRYDATARITLKIDKVENIKGLATVSVVKCQPDLFKHAYDVAVWLVKM